MQQVLMGNTVDEPWSSCYQLKGLFTRFKEEIMALWDNVTKSLGGSLTTNLLLGAAAVIIAPIVVPAALALLRPVAKMAIKGSVLAYDKASEMVAEAGEQLSDLVAEARAELHTSASSAPPEA
jgi:hypothetical protein